MNLTEKREKDIKKNDKNNVKMIDDQVINREIEEFSPIREVHQEAPNKCRKHNRNFSNVSY